MVYKIGTGSVENNSITTDLINDDAVTADKLGSDVAQGQVPIGGIIMFSGLNAPTGYVFCDDSSEAIAAGAPDLRDKFVVGFTPSSGNTTYPTLEMGATGGAATHTLTVDEMPSHNHPFPPNSDASVDYYWKGQADLTPDFTFNAGATYELSTTTGVASQGGGQAHNNLPPYYALAFIMRIS